MSRSAEPPNEMAKTILCGEKQREEGPISCIWVNVALKSHSMHEKRKINLH